MIGNKIVDKITKVSRILPQESESETGKFRKVKQQNTKFDKEIPKKDIYLQKKDRKLLMVYG